LTTKREDVFLFKRICFCLFVKHITFLSNNPKEYVFLFYNSKREYVFQERRCIPREKMYSKREDVFQERRCIPREKMYSKREDVFLFCTTTYLNGSLYSK
jgi:hypothetical protein